VFGVFVLFCFLHNTAPATFRHGIIISGSPASCLEPDEPAFDLPSVLGFVCDNSRVERPGDLFVCQFE
jgi:GMP synthase-like glutamine amidotransferase